jgi:hypothetical protein
VSHVGGDNHFTSAKERDLRPLLEEGSEALELDQEKALLMEAFLEDAWFSGTRNGHAKLLNQAIRCREDPDCARGEIPIEPAQLAGIETEFKAMMEASAEALNLSLLRTVKLWDFLSRAWISGVHTYESEVMASLLERRSDVASEALRWLESGGLDSD